MADKESTETTGVIHCKDCKYISFMQDGLPPIISLACAMIGHADELGPEDYCSKGTKKEV